MESLRQTPMEDEQDGEVLRQWRERRPAEALCRTCDLYPRCVRLKRCVIRTETCSPVEREGMRLGLRQGILEAYEEWKASRRA